MAGGGVRAGGGVSEDVAPRGRDSYRHWYDCVLRYNDTDRQGHVNNVSFATFVEQGRADFLLGAAAPALPEGATFVLARICLDYLHEVFWPGTVSVGTGVLGVGRTSMRLAQGMFVGEACVAAATSVIVLVDAQGRPVAWPEDVRGGLAGVFE
ncbi:MAG: acyl-CoA thioesterase [Janthinobacterium lividum]